MFQHTMESFFATTVILFVERINVYKPRMIFMLLCTWYRKETFPVIYKIGDLKMA